MEYNDIDIRKACELNINPQYANEFIDKVIKNALDGIGLYYRLFGRFKDYYSIANKLNMKQYCGKKKMSDLYGVRIALYYFDDIDIVVELVKKLFDICEIVNDKYGTDSFGPERLNIVAKLPVEYMRRMSDTSFGGYPIDTTFEIQIRTVFSEGWHEVEHDMRYKCKDSWNGFATYDRQLNGIYATLTTCDWAIKNLFESLSYENYKKSKWEDMIRNKFRVRMKPDEHNSIVLARLDSCHELAKTVFRFDRMTLIEMIGSFSIGIPITIYNIVVLINVYESIDSDLLGKTSEVLKKQVEQFKMHKA